jgi:SAM-dependent methyltransferase
MATNQPSTMDRNEPFFDYRKRAARQQRALRIGKTDAGFLVDLAAEEIADRLAATKREFRNGLDLLTPTPAFSQMLGTARPGLKLQYLDERELADTGATRDDLHLAPGSLDLVVSALGLHWSNDLPGSFVQVRRALKPDGLFMATLPGEGTLAELRESLIAAESALSGGAGVRVDPFIDIRQAGSLLQRAGFALPVADIEHHVVRYGTVVALIDDLRAMGATSVRTGSSRPLPHGLMEKLGAVYAERFADADGRLRASFNFVHLTGWAPHESQQQPLRPGSAQASLAEHLKRQR